MEGAADIAVAEPLEAPPSDAGAVVGVPVDPAKDADKAARRKDANRVSAKKSRERKAQTLEAVRKENEELKARVAQLEAALAAAEGRPVPAPPADALAFGAAEGGADTEAPLPIKKQKR